MIRRRHLRMGGRSPLLAGVVLVLVLAACTSNDPSATPQSVPQPTPQPTATPQPTPTPQPTATPIVIPPTPTPISLAPLVGTSPTPAPDGPTPTPTPTPEPLLTTADLVDRVTPSVVHIGVTTLNGGSAAGTGVVFERGGLIMTNRHVVQDAVEVRVSLADGRILAGEIVGVDASIDIAVLRVDADDLPVAVIGDSDPLRVGEDVVAIGHALDLPGGPTVSKGVVSALDRSLADGADVISDLIQTDAAINPGNSGGPLLNTRGEVIGINTAKIPTGDGIGFAIEINIANEVAVRLVAQSAIEPGFIGIGPLDITPTLADQLGLPVLRGVGVLTVVPGSPADGALQVDDIIIQIDGTAIPDTLALEQFLRTRPAGTAINITFFRGSAGLLSAVVTLGERPG